ncbi:MAG: PaaI family thioesterase, partial [Bacteroidota bacterium]
SGVRVKEVDEDRCVVTVPYKWFSTNPFRSTYFACLAMAAEMSTGVLCMMHVYKRSPKVSMLVIKLEANYFKKATGITTFTCNEGNAIREAIEKAVTTGEAQVIKTKSSGMNENAEPVAEFFITWSFKAK